jgi:hypothetical protein
MCALSILYQEFFDDVSDTLLVAMFVCAAYGLFVLCVYIRVYTAASDLEGS